MHPLTIEVGPIDTVEIFDKVIVTTSEDAGMATRHPVRIDEQIAEMEAHLDDIDFEDAAKVEKELRHDVMSHVHVFGKSCPTAMPIIHLGATSCFVTDNSELIQLRDSMEIIKKKLYLQQW